MTDNLQKFMFHNATVRGEFVELSSVWKHILMHHQYPAAVKQILGELSSAAVLLCANLKFNGSMIIQIHGDGPIKLLVVECNNQLQIRAMAKLDEHAVIADDASLPELINAQGKGRFVITLDPDDKKPGQQAYQGIVPIHGKSIATVIENYMRQSEQLETRLWLACDDHVCRGMLLQALPYTGGKDTSVSAEISEEDFSRACILGETLQREELLSNSSATLLHRLFWEETLRVFEPQYVTFACSCSREKVANMLTMLGKEEVNQAVETLGALEINCDFCEKPYRFDAVDCAQLFLSPESVVCSVSGKTH